MASRRACCGGKDYRSKERCPKGCERVKIWKSRITRIQDCDNDTFVDTNENFADPDVVHVRSNNGTFIDGAPGAPQIQGPALQGPGQRFYWYPSKAALRSGSTTGDAWDDPNVGFASTAMGIDTIASGEASFATGIGTVAAGRAAVATGRGDGTLIAQGDSSSAHGISEENSTIAASGLASEARGLSSGGGNITASGAGASSSGFTDSGTIVAQGQGALSAGVAVESGTVQAQGEASFSQGRVGGGLSAITAIGVGSSAQGQALITEGLPGVINATGDGSHAYGAALGGTISTLGAGSTAGGVSIGGAVIGTTGAGSIAHGQGTGTSNVVSAGIGSLVVGVAEDGANINEDGIGNAIIAAHALTADIVVTAPAAGCLSSGVSSAAPGISATGNGATARGFARGEGLAASGDGATAIGVDVSALADYSYATGLGTISNVEGVFVHGIYGLSKDTILTPDEGSFDARYSFQLAGGTSPADRAPPEQGISAVIFTTAFGNDPMGAMITDTYYTGSADFAEYFEWEDGNRNREDRVGRFVSLAGDNGKIAIQKEGEEFIGVVSGSPGFVGDAALHWKGANLRDDFGRVVLRPNYLVGINEVLVRHRLAPLKKEGGEDVKRALKYIQSSKLDAKEKALASKEIEDIKPLMEAAPNSAKKNEPYVSRITRPEWAPVAIVGKVAVRDNGQCKPREKCSARGGIAVPGDKYIVLRRISDKVVLVLIR